MHGGTADVRSEYGDAHFELIGSVVGTANRALAGGASALDVVVAAVVELEDSGLLDAGKGSFRNAAGFVETDAALMDGDSGRAGAVAAMQRLKNPILGARIVMQRTPHVLFVGPVGEQTLVTLGAEVVADPGKYFRPRRNRADAADTGTVGAVALDRHGHLAAATSTGGTPGKMPGRVGDSPIIGASTFANDRYALSATGVGEYFIRRSVARDIAMRAEYQGLSLQAASDYVIHRLIGDMDGVSGGIIAISRDGDIVLSTANNCGELHGYASESIAVTVGVAITNREP